MSERKIIREKKREESKEMREEEVEGRVCERECRVCIGLKST